MESEEVINEMSREDKKLFRKKFIVYPLMEYLIKENKLMSIIPKDDLDRTTLLYGFSANIKKKDVLIYLKQLDLKIEYKCVIRSFIRPTAIITFPNKISCDKGYDIIRLDLQHKAKNIIDSTLLWTIAKASNFNQRIPIKNKLDRSKIILRNLPFTIKEDEIYNILKSYGPIVSIKFPTKIENDGNLIRKGCCFVQFCKENDALRVVKSFNEKLIKGRPVVVDIAIDKTIYEQQQLAETISSDESDHNDYQQMDEISINDSNKSTELLDWEITTHPYDEVISNQNEKKSYKNNDELNRRTIFVQNISWTTKLDDFKDFMENKYGETEFCQFVVDKQFNQPKGSAFVRFISLDTYNKCINQSKYEAEESVLDGKVLKILPALNREELSNITSKQKNQKNDNDRRNLGLLSLGLVYKNNEPTNPNERIFNGLLLTSIEKNIRAQTLKEKQIKLKNTNFFVSKTRLCVRNIPFYVDESLLSRTFQKLGGKTCRLKNTKLERFNPTGTNKKGKSKGYGFVEFNSHQCALTALKSSANQYCTSIFPSPTLHSSVDNMPTTKYGTLIVEFSVENAQTIKKYIKMKQKLRKSQNNQHKRFFTPIKDTPALLSSNRKRKVPNLREIKINN